MLDLIFLSCLLFDQWIVKNANTLPGGGSPAICPPDETGAIGHLSDKQ
tara:strand:- start:301 stop:444 length:144 start_codon:yes stop_codon:yes gene_type:complete